MQCEHGEEAATCLRCAVLAVTRRAKKAEADLRVLRDEKDDQAEKWEAAYLQAIAEGAGYSARAKNAERERDELRDALASIVELANAMPPGTWTPEIVRCKNIAHDALKDGK
jgi:hypothetical protein